MTVVAPPSVKRWELEVVVPVEDMADLAAQNAAAEPGADDPAAPPGASLDLAARRGARSSTWSSSTARRSCSRTHAGWPSGSPPGSTRSPPRGAATSPATTPHPPGSPAQVMAQSGAARGAPGLLARAHHGSVSKEQRAGIEDELKAGLLPCVVATSQPRARHRHGRGRPGHPGGGAAVGRKRAAARRPRGSPGRRGLAWRALPEAPRRSGPDRGGRRADARGPDRGTAHHREPARRARPADRGAASLSTNGRPTELFALVRRSAPFADLPRSAYDATLDMLVGPLPVRRVRGAAAAPGLGPGRRHSHRASRRAAPRGHRRRHDPGPRAVRRLPGRQRRRSGGPRVGELDEEMVYESRVGDVFALGTSSWRIEEITHDRVLVSPAPGEPGRLPFWKGDTLGRPAELGAAIGAFVREVGEARPSRRRSSGPRRPVSTTGPPATSSAYLAEQRADTGVVPTDRQLVVERFRDELGDWRLVVHSPYGAQVHAPWALAIGAAAAGAVRRRRPSDVRRRRHRAADPRHRRRPRRGRSCACSSRTRSRRSSTTEVGGSALFASRFRECAARALLLPRRDPGRRSPLWQQRQRSAAAARRSPASTARSRSCSRRSASACRTSTTCPALLQLMRDIESRRIRLVEVETHHARSPFARSLLFGYVARVHVRRRLTARRAAGRGARPRPGAAGRAARPHRAARAARRRRHRRDRAPSCSGCHPSRQARDAEGVADLLRLLGPLTTAEVAERVPTPRLGRRLADRAGRSPPGWSRSAIAGEDRVGRRSRTWAGCATRSASRCPLGVPEAFTEPVARPARRPGGALRPHARPVPAADVAARLGLGVAVVARRAASAGRTTGGCPRASSARRRGAPSGATPRCCACSGAGRWPAPAQRGRAGRARARSPGSCRPGSTSAAGCAGSTACSRVVEQLAGCPVRHRRWSRSSSPSRVAEYQPAMLDELTSAGEVVWAGAGRAARHRRLGLAAPGRHRAADPARPRRPRARRAHQAVLDVLGGGGAFFFRQLADARRVDRRPGTSSLGVSGTSSGPAT